MARTEELYAALKSTLVNVLTVGTWDRIANDHRRVGLEWRPEYEPGWGKPKYVIRVLDDLDRPGLVALGQRCLDVLTDRPRAALQDAMWWIETEGTAAVSEITRREIARALDGRLMNPEEGPHEFIARITGRSVELHEYHDGLLCKVGFDLADLAALLSGRGSKASGKSYTPVTHLQLLEEQGFFAWPDKRVFLFLEGLVHPTVRRGSEQEEWVDFLNRILGVDGLRLSETSRLSQHPVFTVERSRGGVAGRAKNLIFASSVKPDLRFRDAVNNDVEIVTNADKVLVYDRPIGPDGLRWRDLQEWWCEREGLSSQREARRTLYRRLMDSVPETSPPQRFLFREFFAAHRDAFPELPALLPEVWLHWDPKTARVRGAAALARHRMDFLMLLPGGVRIVLEVDGQHHYSSGGHADPSLYAIMAAADRDLRLAGYEVYRFGSVELDCTEEARVRVRQFFVELFRKHDVVAKGGAR